MTALEGARTWSSYLMQNNGGGSSVGDDESVAGPEPSDDGDESVHGDDIHAAAPVQDPAGSMSRPHFGNDNGPWLSTASVFGDNGESPQQVVVIEIEAKDFECNGGVITLDSFLNVPSDDMSSTSDHRREAAAVLTNLLLGSTVGGSIANGTQEAEDDPSDKNEKVYSYYWKDPNAPTMAHPCFTIHIEEVHDHITKIPFKYRLWYMVWEPGFTIARSIASQLHQNSITYKDAQARGSAAGKKRMAARAELETARAHVKTRGQSIRDGGDLHNEYSKYFDDRSAKVTNMNYSEYAASVSGLGSAHPCAMEQMLNPRDPLHGPTVLASTPSNDAVQIHTDQSNPRRYFDDNGRFYPPPYVREYHLFNTLHPKFVGNRDVRMQPLPTRGVLTPGQTLLIDHFAKCRLKVHPDICPKTKERCFEAFLAGKDYDPANTTRSRVESAAWETAKYAFSSNKYSQKTENKDGVRSHINPLLQLRAKHDRLDRLLAEGAETRDDDENEKLHAAVREMVLKNTKMVMEQRKEQLPKGTRHFWQVGLDLIDRRKSPMSTTKSKVYMKNKSMFHGFVERLYTFARQYLGAQDPMAITLFLVNSLASSTLAPGYVVSVYGPAGVGKSTMFKRYMMMGLPGMNQQSQVQSTKARLRDDPYNAYHEWLDEANAMFEGLKISGKTPEQLDVMNGWKRKVTEQMTAHGIPEEVLQADGRKVLEDVQLLTPHSQSITMLRNGNAVFGVSCPDDMTKSVLRRLINYCILEKFEDSRWVSEPSASDPALVEACEDYQKNEFLTRLLLTLAVTSSEFEVDCTTANELFRRMDLADGRSFMESGFMEHRRMLFKIFTTWYAVQCVFDATNYHDRMPELFDTNGHIKPWSIEMMTLCVPFLKTPSESIINYVWHFHDSACLGRGPVVDQTMSLLAKEAGFKACEYGNLSPYDTPSDDMDAQNQLNQRFMNAVSLGKDEPINYQDLMTLYSEETIKDVLDEVQTVETAIAENTQVQQQTLVGMRKIETNVVGTCAFLKERRPLLEHPIIDWRFVETGYRTVPDLAFALFCHADRELNITAEVITGALYWLKQHVTEHVGVETDGPIVRGQTAFCYHSNATPTAKPTNNEDGMTGLIQRAIYEYEQFPAILATSTNRSTQKEAVLVAKKGASAEKSEKRARGEGDRNDMPEHALCVQTHALKEHATREHYGMLYASTHPQIMSNENFLHRHALARAKLIADKVFDQEENEQMVTPYHHKSTFSPLYVNTTEDVDKTVWTTTTKHRAHDSLSAEKLCAINGVQPKVIHTNGRSNPVYDKFKASELWRFHAHQTLRKFGWSNDTWLGVVNDARTNKREHMRGTVVDIATTSSAAASSAAASSSSYVPELPEVSPLDL